MFEYVYKNTKSKQFHSIVVPPEIYVQSSIPDVGTSITVSSTPHTELQPIPPGEVDGDGHVLRGGRPHDHPRPADAGPVIDWPQLVVPRSAAGDDLAEDQVS